MLLFCWGRGFHPLLSQLLIPHLPSVTAHFELKQLISVCSYLCSRFGKCCKVVKNHNKPILFFPQHFSNIIPQVKFKAWVLNTEPAQLRAVGSRHRVEDRAEWRHRVIFVLLLVEKTWNDSLKSFIYQGGCCERFGQGQCLRIYSFVNR